jgi:DHA1 family bicyclomycin/chloramphenicol resistance-like MFS transporter
MLGLKETRPQGVGTSLRPSAVLQSYRTLITDRHFVGHALTGALANGAYFAYLTGSPFVLMGIFALSPRAYGWLFALNSMGLVLGSQVNEWLLARHRLEKLLSRANVAAVVVAAALLLLSITELGGVIAFATLLFGFVASRAFIRSNATAIALEFQADRAGTASALIGALQFAFGTLGGALLSVLHDGTSRPLTLLLTLYAVLGLTLQRALGRGMRPHAV